MKSLSAAILCFAVGCPDAQAADFPNFNFERTCRETPPVGMDAKTTYDSCVASERSARDSLKDVWGRASANTRRECRTLTEMGGAPSYVELITCLEMRQSSLQEQPKAIAPGTVPVTRSTSTPVGIAAGVR